MRSKIIKYRFYISLFTAAFVVGLILPHLRTRAVSASTGLGEYNYGDESEHLDTAIIAYHSIMNETVNSYLEKLTSEANPDVSYPESADECMGSNVSTYCLAVLLSGELTDFEKAISTRGKSFREADEGNDPNVTIEDATNEQTARKDLVMKEIQSAEDTLDLTLATYNEIQNVYPLHKELTTLIKNLEAYNKQLSKIRDIVEIYPYKFNDATTIECK